MAGIVAAVVAVILPLGYFVLSYQNQAGALDAEAEINGHAASEIINANPEMWRFQQRKLEEFLSRRPRHGYAESRRIFDLDHKIVAESVDPLYPPLLTRTVDLRDSGVVVGTIEISRSLQPLLLGTGLVGLLGLLLGAVVFVTLRLLPLRALDRAQADNIRLLEESERRIKEQEALIAVATAVSQSLRLDQLLDIVLEKVLEVSGRERVSIRLKDPDTGAVTLVAHRGFSQEEVDNLRGIVKHEITEQVFASGKPIVINSRSEAPPTQALLPQSQSVAWIPIESGVKVVGILGVASGRPVPFSPREVDLLQAIGSVIGVAIENARLFDEAERNVEGFRTISEISQSILTSLDLKSTLAKILEETLALGSYDLGAIRLVDAKTEMFEPVVGQGYCDPENIKAHSKRASDLTSGRSFREVMSRKTARVEENLQHCEGLRTLKREGIQTAVLVPVSTEEEVLGVLHVGCRMPRRFPPDEVHLLETIGKQIGIAVQKARLNQEIQDNLDRVRALNEIGAATGSTLDLHAVLDLLMGKIELFLPYTALLVWLTNKESGVLERAACWNLAQEEWMGRKLKATPALVQEAVESRAPVMVKNLLTDPRTLDREFYRRHELISYLGVPLIVQGEVLGVLVFLTRQEHEFTAQEIEFLSTLSGQAAIAIHNSQLHEQTRRQAEDLETANRQLSVLLAELSRLYTALTPLGIAAAPKQLFEMAVDRLLQATGADAGLFRVLDEAAAGYIYLSQRGFPEDYLQRVRVVRRQSAADIVYAGGEPIIAADVSQDERIANKTLVASGFNSCAFLPFKVKGEVRGVIHLASRQLGYFSEERKEHLLAIARLMGIVVENSELFAEINTAKEELEKASRVKDEFLGFVSHELRTPLNAVIAYTLMMQDKLLGEINAEQEQGLEKISKYSKELLGMINSLLEVTRIQAGRVELESHRVDLVRFIEELKAAYDAPIGKPITLNWDIAPDLPGVRTDSGKLRHILQNLITNAIKYTERGSVSISTRRCPEDGGVRFEVMDTGIGIPRDSLPVIFEMFRQVSRPDGRSSTGVGLGLHIVKKFTEMLGGTIEVESEVGKGSTFTVTIPSDRNDSSATESIPV